MNLFKLGCTVVVDPSSGEDTNDDLSAVLLFFGALVEKKRKRQHHFLHVENRVVKAECIYNWELIRFSQLIVPLEKSRMLISVLHCCFWCIGGRERGMGDIVAHLSHKESFGVHCMALKGTPAEGAGWVFQAHRFHLDLN